MLSKVFSAVNIGLDSRLVEVETDVSYGFPCFEIVGLPDTAVKEAKERVRSAILNSGQKFLPGNQKRLIVNLAPADIKKEGSIYDLPIAIGILFSSGLIAPQDKIKDSLFIGELALDGSLRCVKGVLPMALLAKKIGLRNIFLPEANAKEASLVKNMNIFPLKTLSQLLEWFRGGASIKSFLSQGFQKEMIETESSFDFGYIKGQEYAKRALEIAAAGGHNVLMVGPPGSGKTLLARSLPSILPQMTQGEVLEATKIASISGLLKSGQFIKSERPFRAPHHTISEVAMIGGGQVPKPGEVSLAHRGVLFLDELPEFSRKVLESLRQPLEDGTVSVSRAKGRAGYPAKFILVAAMNPCPCGFFGDPERECQCSPSEIIRYRKKISGPFLDRIDLYLEVPRVEFEKIRSKVVAEKSSCIRQRVERARAIQRKRFKKIKILTNSEMLPQQIEEFCFIDKKAEDLLKKAVEKFAFSVRACHRVLKVARTIADLDGEEEIKSSHLAEAISYRSKLFAPLF